MEYKVIYEKKAIKELIRLPRIVQMLVKKKLIEYTQGSSNVNVRRLQNSSGFLRIRAGNYRIIFNQDNNTKTIYILQIVHRKDAYRRF